MSRSSTVRTTFAWLVLLGAGSSLAGAQNAHAAVVGCRTDPIVLLSNGVKVQLYSDIYDVSTGIKNVSYVLHAPIGTTVVSVSYPTDMTTAIPETFQFFADSEDAKYQSTTYVTDANAQVQVTTYGIATAPSGAVSKTFQHNGKVSQLIKLGMQLGH